MLSANPQNVEDNPTQIARISPAGTDNPRFQLNAVAHGRKDYPVITHTSVEQPALHHVVATLHRLLTA